MSTQPSAIKNPTQVITAAQTDFLRKYMIEKSETCARIGQDSKRKLIKSLPVFVLAAGLVTIIPASVGVASSMGLLNTAANFVAAWTLGKIAVVGTAFVKNRRHAKKALNIANQSDLEVAQSVRELTDTDGLIKKRTKSLKRELALNAGACALMLTCGAATLAGSGSIAQTIVGLILTGVGITSGSIVLPGLRKDIKDPTRDKEISTGLLLATSLKEEGAMDLANNLQRTLTQGRAPNRADRNDQVVREYENKGADSVISAKDEDARTNDDDGAPRPPRAPKV